LAGDARQGGRARRDARDAERDAQGHGRHVHGLRRRRVRPGARDLYDLRGPRSRRRPPGDAARREAGRRPRHPEPLPQRAPGHGLAGGPGRAGLHAPRLEVEPRAQAAPRAGGPRARAHREGKHVQRVAPREVRQPEVARLAALFLALLLVAPAARDGHAMLVAGAFLLEFLSQSRLAPLSALTTAPPRERLAVAGVELDRYGPAFLGGGQTLVLVHGATPHGKDDPRAREAAALLARAGFEVLVPTVPGLTRGRLRQDDVAVVRATLAARPGPAVVLG